MGIGEECAAFGETVHVGRLCLGMAAEAADPVIEVVDGDEENVGLVGSLGQTASNQQDKDRQDAHVHGGPHFFSALGMIFCVRIQSSHRWGQAEQGCADGRKPNPWPPVVNTCSSAGTLNFRSARYICTEFSALI